MMKKTVVVAVLSVAFALSLMCPQRAAAGGDTARSIFLDTFYGMAAGALIGTAISLAQDDPDWGGNIGSGAAIGGIAGALFGMVTEVRYAVEVDHGKMTAGLPRIDVSRRLVSGREDTLLSAGLVRYRF